MIRYEVTILLRGGLKLAQEILTVERAEDRGFDIAQDMDAYAFMIETVVVEPQGTYGGERPKSYVECTTYYFLKSIEEEEAEAQRAAADARAVTNRTK